MILDKANEWIQKEKHKEKIRDTPRSMFCFTFSKLLILILMVKKEINNKIGAFQTHKFSQDQCFPVRSQISLILILVMNKEKQQHKHSIRDTQA